MRVLVKHWMLMKQLLVQWCSRKLFRTSGWSKLLGDESSLISKLFSEGHQNYLFFSFSSSYLVFMNNKVVGSSNKVQEFKVFTDLVNRCLVTVPTRYPIPFSAADYWTNYEFHNKVKTLAWVFLNQTKRLISFLQVFLIVKIQHWYYMCTGS